MLDLIIGGVISTLVWKKIHDNLNAIANLLVKLGLPSSIFHLQSVAKSDPKKNFKHRNSLFSFLHVISSSSLVFSYFYYELNYFPDNYEMTPISPVLLRFSKMILLNSFGYLNIDIYDEFYNNGRLNNWPILLHHVLFSLSLVFAMVTEEMIDFVLGIMSIEFTNLLLNPRTMANVNSENKDEPWLVKLKVINVVWYVSLRFISQSYLTYFVFFEYTRVIAKVGYFFYACCILGAFYLNLMIFVYSNRLIQSDLLALTRKGERKKSG